jgi:hypothetical protein
MRIHVIFNINNLLILICLLVATTSYADEMSWKNTIKSSAPPGITIIRIERSNDDLLINAMADNNKSISAFMRELDIHDLGPLQLKSVDTTSNGQKFLLKYPRIYEVYNRQRNRK